MFNPEFSHQALELLADGCSDDFAWFTPYGGPVYGGRVTMSNEVVVSVSVQPGRPGAELAMWQGDGPTVVVDWTNDFADVAALVGAVCDGDVDLSRLA